MENVHARGAPSALGNPDRLVLDQGGKTTPARCSPGRADGARSVYNRRGGARDSRIRVQEHHAYRWARSRPGIGKSPDKGGRTDAVLRLEGPRVLVEASSAGCDGPTGGSP